MATRFYLSTLGGPDVSPLFTHQAAWTETDSAVRRKFYPYKSGQAMADLALGFATAANTKQLFVQFVSDPLAGQTISAAATFKGSVRCKESAINDNIDAVSCKVLIVSGDGQALRGALANLANYGPQLELDTVLESKRIADGDTVTGGVTVQAGDRLVVEVGLTSIVGGTSITGTMNFGDNAEADLADNETDQSASNPFIEFSHDFVFLQGVEGVVAGMIYAPRAAQVAIARGWG